MAWDATIPDTLAASHLPLTCTQVGTVAAHASASKMQKYEMILNTYHFVPVAMETLGVWNVEGLELMKDIGRRTSVITGDRRETISFFKDCLSLSSVGMLHPSLVHYLKRT